MPNSSASGGYLLNSATAPPADLPLEDILQASLVGLTGLAPDLVRPRWQETTPNQPDFSVNWLAFGASLSKADQNAHLEHDPSVGDGVSHLSRDEYLEVLLSFYGPQGSSYLTAVRDGLAIDQNRWPLMDHGIKLVGIGDPVNVPALLKDRWVRRIDLRIEFSRRISKTFQVNSLTSATVTINRDPPGHPPTTITITP